MYGTIRMHQERQYPGRVVGTELANPDFAAYARSFGAHGETVTQTSEFADALERALGAGTSRLIEPADRPGRDQPAHDAHEDPRGRTAMSGREEIRVPGQPEPISHYTDAVRAGNLLFVSGCVPVDVDGRLVGGDGRRAGAPGIREHRCGARSGGATFADVVK